MGLDFSKSSSMATPENTQQVQKKDEIEVVEQYDIVSDRQQMNTQLVGSQEVDDIVSTIEVNNLETIVSFGSEVAEEISKASDVVLNSMSMSQLDDTSEMLKSLAKIMDKFDIEEIKENPGLLKKLFGNAKKQLDKILEKYHIERPKNVHNFLLFYHYCYFFPIHYISQPTDTYTIHQTKHAQTIPSIKRGETTFS